jgi:hypothetical protein
VMAAAGKAGVTAQPSAETTAALIRKCLLFIGKVSGGDKKNGFERHPRPA